MERFNYRVPDRRLALFAFLILLLAYHLIFGSFFPNNNRLMGHDYSFVLPNLLDGYFWIKRNGLFEPFWFTPAFCGGQPVMGDQGSTFYSVTQLLTLMVDPIASVYLTVLLFASLGFWGFYFLLRSCFGTSKQAAILGGALFMFNGFFIYRMIVGHLSFHAVMLIPWIAYFLLLPTKVSVSTILFAGVAAGSMFAYGAYSGISLLLLPCALAVLAIICIHRFAGHKSSDFAQRSLVAALVATGLSAAKLGALISFLQNFPRSDYLLPGFASTWDATRLLFSALFFSPIDIAQQAEPLLTNAQWALSRHEWEYGVTWIPLLIILAGTVVVISQMRGTNPIPNPAKWRWLALLGLILVLPLALNIYTPGWNGFLKQVPVIKSNSTLLRWFLIYMPVVIIFSALLLDKISSLINIRNGILISALLALITITAFKDREYYQSQPYNPGAIVSAWWIAHTREVQPSIQHINASVDDNGHVQMQFQGNDMLATGGSQLACYNPIFGYRLEHFPVKSLHPGPVLEERNGVLNIKNPACYLYPKQNDCAPGDHFTAAQLGKAQTFANYKPYRFEFSPSQVIANWMTRITLTLLVLLFFVTVGQRILRSYNKKWSGRQLH
jgi:hypothetical protein